MSVSIPLATIDALSREGNLPAVANVIMDSKDPEYVAALIAKLPDDVAISALAAIKAVRQQMTEPFYNAENAIENEIGKRLVQRRDERGGDQVVAIPHPYVEVKLEAQYAPYQIDADQLAELLPALEPEEQRKLVHIIPAHTVPAHDVPEQILPGNTTSILALQKKYAGSNAAPIFNKAVKRVRLPDKITIRPKKTALAP